MARKKLNQFLGNTSRTPALSTQSLAASAASKPDSTATLLNEIKGLRSDLRTRPQVKVERVSMPQNFHVDRDTQKIVRVAKDSQREWMRNLTRMGE